MGEDEGTTMIKLCGVCTSFSIIGILVFCLFWRDFWYVETAMGATCDKQITGIGYSGLLQFRPACMGVAEETKTKFIFDSDVVGGDSASDDVKTCANCLGAGWVFAVLACIVYSMNMCINVMDNMSTDGGMGGGMGPLCTSFTGGLFVVLALLLGATGCSKDMYGPTVTLDLGLSFIFMIIAAVLSLVDCAVGYLAMGETQAAAAGPEGGSVHAKTDDGVSMEEGAAAAPGAVLAAPAAEEDAGPAPEGGVYMKNGMWYDQDDRPIQQ